VAAQIKKNVLIVDKQPKELAYLERQLMMAGFAVRYTRTGAGAIRNVEERAPDVMIIEIDLSDMSGTDVVKTIRENAARARTPIIAISALPHMKDRCLDVGCDEFMQKPLKVLDLVARARKLSR
jgi:DNA-binding response OmpR family regulator